MSLDFNNDGLLDKKELLQGLCTVMNDTEAKTKVEELFRGADAELSNFIDYSGFIMVAYKVESSTIKNIKKRVDFLYSCDGKNSMIFVEFAKKLLGEKDYEEKPELVTKLKES